MAYTLNEEEILRGLAGGEVIGSRIITQDQVESTNDLARRELIQGAPPGTVVLADSQSRGKGRLGREWYSEPGTGIYLSILLPTPAKPAAPLTLVAAVGLVTAMNAFSQVKGELKWPNDVLLNERKAAGILTEYISEKGVSGCVVGIGVNCNQERFPSPLRALATSLRMENGAPIDRVPLVAAILNEFDLAYRHYLATGLAPILKRWTENTEMFGRRVTVHQGPVHFSATALNLDTEGRLVVLTDEGEERSLDSGEVSLQA